MIIRGNAQTNGTENMKENGRKRNEKSTMKQNWGKKLLEQNHVMMIVDDRLHTDSGDKEFSMRNWTHSHEKNLPIVGGNIPL